MTEGEIEKRLKEAVDVMNRMKMSGLWPSVRQTWWPDVVNDYWDYVGWDYTAYRTRPALPTASEISRMDQTLDWFANADLTPFARKLVWSRAAGVKWRMLEDWMGYSARHLQTWHKRALAKILADRKIAA